MEPSFPIEYSVYKLTRFIQVENAEWKFCATGCPVTCDTKPDPHIACSSECVQRCECKLGYVAKVVGGTVQIIRELS